LIVLQKEKIVDYFLLRIIAIAKTVTVATMAIMVYAYSAWIVGLGSGNCVGCWIGVEDEGWSVGEVIVDEEEDRLVLSVGFGVCEGDMLGEEVGICSVLFSMLKGIISG